jgi:hypothetical protein
VLTILLCAGCAATDPCAGHDGTCVALEVQGSGSVDQLDIKVVGASQLSGRTPPQAGASHALPVTTALFFPSVGGAVDIDVVGLLGGSVVGAGTTTALLRPGEHQSVIVQLIAGNHDLGMPHDLASEDLASEDLTTSDLTSEDMQKLPRLIFLLTPVQDGNSGSIALLDTFCSNQAGGNFRALLDHLDDTATPSPTPLPANQHIVLGQGRPIVLPSGKQVATDSTFFTATHMNAIDERFNGTQVPSGCAWTHFDANGSTSNDPDTCNYWSNSTTGAMGDYGDISAIDATWAHVGSQTCDQSCYIICIQQ